jgi:hypothetical protein
MAQAPVTIDANQYRRALLQQICRQMRSGTMRRKAIGLLVAALVGFTAIAAPKKAEAHNGWWIPGAIFGGLAAGAIVSGAYWPGYYNDPCCYYYPRRAYYYYAPRYDFAPRYYPYYRPYQAYYRPYHAYYRPYRAQWRHRYYRYYPRYRYYRHRYYHRRYR